MSDHVLEPTVRADGSPTLPRRGYSREPFAPGNQVAVRHGAFSDQIVSANAEEVRSALAEMAPWVIDTDRPAVERYCRAEARSRILHAFCVKTSIERGVDGVPAYLWTEATRAEANAAKFGSDLGLDPAGRARLAKDLGLANHLAGDQLTDLASEGRKVRKEAEARLMTTSSNGHEEPSQIAHTPLVEPDAVLPTESRWTIPRERQHDRPRSRPVGVPRSGEWTTLG